MRMLGVDELGMNPFAAVDMFHRSSRDHRGCLRGTSLESVKEPDELVGKKSAGAKRYLLLFYRRAVIWSAILSYSALETICRVSISTASV